MKKRLRIFLSRFLLFMASCQENEIHILSCTVFHRRSVTDGIWIVCCQPVSPGFINAGEFCDGQQTGIFFLLKQFFPPLDGLKSCQIFFCPAQQKFLRYRGGQRSLPAGENQCGKSIWFQQGKNFFREKTCFCTKIMIGINTDNGIEKSFCKRQCVSISIDRENLLFYAKTAENS